MIKYCRSIFLKKQTSRFKRKSPISRSIKSDLKSVIVNLTNISFQTFYGLSLPSEKMSIEIKSISLIGSKFLTFLLNRRVIPALKNSLMRRYVRLLPSISQSRSHSLAH